MGVEADLRQELTEHWNGIRTTVFDGKPADAQAQQIPADLVNTYIALGVYLAEEDYWREGLYLLEHALQFELERRIMMDGQPPQGGVPAAVTPQELWKTGIWHPGTSIPVGQDPHSTRDGMHDDRYAEAVGHAVDSWRKRAALGQVDAFKAYDIKHTHHLLAAVLSEMERRRGFTVVNVDSAEHGPLARVPLYTGFVQPPQFLEMVRLGSHWKDPTVPGDHGEFTHRIQWYMLLTINSNESRETGGQDIVNIYKSIGKWFIPPSEHTPDNDGKGRYLSVWDCLFDRSRAGTGKLASYYETKSELDFRSPENLHLFLMKDETAESYPLLCALVTGRHAKRVLQGLNDEQKVKKAGPVYGKQKAGQPGYEKITANRATSYFGVKAPAPPVSSSIKKAPILLPKNT